MAYVHTTNDNSTMGIFLGLLVGIVIAVLLVVGVRSFGVLDGGSGGDINVELPGNSSSGGTTTPNSNLNPNGGNSGTLTQ